MSLSLPSTHHLAHSHISTSPLSSSRNSFSPNISLLTPVFPHYLKTPHSPLTGHVGWGIAWYINGLLIPEIYVVRGKTYTFVVEGGNNPDRPERDHPFYITDDPEGGYGFKTPAERSVSATERGREGRYLQKGTDG